jgi:hypothetical protein
MFDASEVIVRTKLLQGAAILILVTTAFGAGYTVGHRTTFRWMMEFLGAETRGNLSQRVETLARLRTGDERGAIVLLERAVDRAAETLAQGQPFSELPAATQRALRLAKAYRDVYPPMEPSADLTAVLEMTPLPDVEYCSPALRKLVEDAKARTKAIR